ncbi:MAG: XRE family transcriptional regulator [Caulobacteraceae bacterium]|nr:XRE family transcriptional regulator [Caulobacteraceae bacterium]
MLDLGERLSIARNRARVGVGQMAKYLNRQRNMVTIYERGDNAPLWVVRRYAEVLGNCTVEWLVAEVGSSPARLPKFTFAEAVTCRSFDATQSLVVPMTEPHPLVGVGAVGSN